MGTLTSLGIGILGSLVVAIVFDLAAPLARLLARRAAKKLPEQDRETVLEQWLADIAAMSSSIGKLWIAIGLSKAGIALGRLPLLGQSRRGTHFESITARLRGTEVRIEVTRSFADVLKQLSPFKLPD